MSTVAESYFTVHNLYDPKTLAEKCEKEGVRIARSDKYLNLVMLHYDAPLVHFANNWTEFNRMCRGLIVDLKNKKIIAYPFDKFFNLDEQPETEIGVLLNLGDFEVSEKLDGSMIIIFKDPNTGKYVATTKGSFDSEHGEFITKRITPKLKNDALHNKYTLIFELIEKKFQIVVNYEKKGYRPGLYLIGARDRISNQLLPFKEVQILAQELDLPTIKTYEFKTLSEVVKTAKTLSVLEEGYVIRYKKNGRLVKLKGDEYLYAHRFISCLSQKYIIEALGEGITPQELVDTAPEEYKEDVLKDAKVFQEDHRVLVGQIHDYYNDSYRLAGRKEFALWVQEYVPPDLRPFLFKIHDTKPLDTRKVYAVIAKRKGVSGETKL